MVVFLDLDGTLVNTVHPGWKPYKDGVQNYPVNQIPIFSGAKEFIESRKAKGDTLIIVSDSHPSYVNPIAQLLGLDSISLADKPNISKLNSYINQHTEFKQKIEQEGSCFVGDTKLDIELGRRMKALTVWFCPYAITDAIKDVRDGIGDEMASLKTGPTYVAKTFSEIETFLDSPLENLYTIEGAFAGYTSTRFINFWHSQHDYIVCLARQEQGECDKYARADMYFQLSNPERTQEYLKNVAKGVSCFLNRPGIKDNSWDYLTYLTDKATTIPRYKMKEVFDLVETAIPKIELLKWAENTEGSLRNMKMYHDRREFLERYLSVSLPNEAQTNLYGQYSADPKLSLKGKNIIVLDDQLTTGATAWHVLRKLRECGANNILFIAMFQMVLAVNNDNVLCPRCGKPMTIKIRRKDGHHFYSCTPPLYGGDGCGFAYNIPN
jgi:phosphoglycolate phosphatase-like HAD superfamily hydrolase